jgi:cell division protein FtsL
MADSIPVSERYGGQEMEKLRSSIDRPAIPDMSPGARLAAVMVLAAVVASVGLVIYQRRQHRSLIKRLQDVMPEMDELRASLKRPLERAVRVL